MFTSSIFQESKKLLADKVHYVDQRRYWIKIFSVSKADAEIPVMNGGLVHVGDLRGSFVERQLSLHEDWYHFLMSSRYSRTRA